MIAEQVEKDLDQEPSLFWWSDYWDAVYLAEEERLKVGEAIEDETDSTKIRSSLDPHLLIL